MDVVANKAGERVTPTILAMLDSEEFVVGEPARQRAVRNPGSTISHNLQFCNSNLENEVDIANATKSMSCRVEGPPFVFSLEIGEHNRDLTPFDTNIEIFKNVLCNY